MAVLSGGELYDIAAGIENNGAAYYESLVESTTDADLKSTYGRLADMERHHVEVFRKLRANADLVEVVPQADEAEYGSYLKALIDSSVFTNDRVARDLAIHAAGPAEALQLALGAEKDSILFYSEMKGLVPPRERDAVDAIIKEERTHVRDLSALRQRYI